ncbi:MAG: ATP-binding cassette domain-containing protein, partial [Oscillospiraceae bacterium]
MPFDGTITAKNICKTFQKEKVLKNVSVTLNKGECLGVLGYNGCGKSTLLSIIAGTLTQDLGEV